MVDLALEDSDVYYFESRTARDESKERKHEQRSVGLFLAGVGHLRLGQVERALTPLAFAKDLEGGRGRMYADALLLVAGLPVEHRPANAEADLETLLKAVPNALSAASANELLWLLGVPAMRRDQVRALVERRALATHAAEAVVAALRVADSDRETAQKLLKAARAKLGFVVP